jgi:hypothetical protein
MGWKGFGPKRETDRRQEGHCDATTWIILARFTFTDRLRPRSVFGTRTVPSCGPTADSLWSWPWPIRRLSQRYVAANAACSRTRLFARTEHGPRLFAGHIQFVSCVLSPAESISRICRACGHELLISRGCSVCSPRLFRGRRSLATARVKRALS